MEQRIKGCLAGLIITMGMLLAGTAAAQPFKNGDRVCFVGNSITHEGQFTNYIALYYATRYPDQKIYFFNAGIAGDVAAGIIARTDSDILSNKPNIAVLMVGMNDVNRDLYLLKNIGDTAVDRQKAEAIKTYRINTTRIADRFKKLGIRMVFELPTIYDETARFARPELSGVNAALGKCANFLRSAAPAYHATIVDYRSIMLKVNHEQQMKDSAFTIVGTDRIHPAGPGHLVMTYQFIKSTGAASLISKTVIDVKAASVVQAINCHVVLKSAQKNAVKFTSLEDALPYPVEKEAMPALNYISFTQDLNQEILQVKGLKPGSYHLLIDQVDTGLFTDADLNEGINLATDTLTPQYLQAIKVKQLCDDYHNTWLNLRAIAFVEYTKLPNTKNSSYITNKAFLKNNPDTDSWLQQKDAQYIIYKPQQKELFKQLDTLRNEIYIANKPIEHLFELVK